jgi:hypothetical protein
MTTNRFQGALRCETLFNGSGKGIGNCWIKARKGCIGRSRELVKEEEITCY